MSERTVAFSLRSFAFASLAAVSAAGCNILFPLAGYSDDSPADRPGAAAPDPPDAAPDGCVACGGACVDTRVDPDHCGACGHRCNDTRCDEGLCVPGEVGTISGGAGNVHVHGDFAYWMVRLDRGGTVLRVRLADLPRATAAVVAASDAAGLVWNSLQATARGLYWLDRQGASLTRVLFLPWASAEKDGPPEAPQQVFAAGDGESVPRFAASDEYLFLFLTGPNNLRRLVRVTVADGTTLMGGRPGTTECGSGDMLADGTGVYCFAVLPSSPTRVATLRRFESPPVPGTAWQSAPVDVGVLLDPGGIRRDGTSVLVLGTNALLRVGSGPPSAVRTFDPPGQGPNVGLAADADAFYVTREQGSLLYRIPRQGDEPPLLVAKAPITGREMRVATTPEWILFTGGDGRLFFLRR